MNTNPELPLGLGMALAQNVKAMESFCAMSQQQKAAVIARTHNIRSKQEMHAYVESLAAPNSFQG